MVISVNNFQHIADGGSYTVPGTSSNNRLVVIIPCIRTNQDVLYNSVTLGGASATALLSTERTANLGIEIMTGLWYIKEANIPSGAQTLDIEALDNEGAGLGTELTSKVTCSIFTIYDFDQASTPYYENPPVEITAFTTGAQLISNNYGSNIGKFAVGIAMSAGNEAEAYTITSNLGDLVGQGNNNGINSVTQLDAVNYRCVKIDSLAGNGESTQFTIDYPSSGSSSNGAILNIAYALVFDEASASPTITINEASLEPGGAISGSYSNFTNGVPPTSPLSLSDGTNTITTAVSITDNGSGGGTFSGTLPNLPAAGNSSTFILFGNVTATLDDA